MNRERLIVVRDFLVAHKERFDYRTFCGRDEVKPRGFTVDIGVVAEVCERLEKDCGTVGCVAGWTVALFPKEAELSGAFGISNIAQEILKLSYIQGNILFSSSNYFKYDDGGYSFAVGELTRLIEDSFCEPVGELA